MSDEAGSDDDTEGSQSPKKEDAATLEIVRGAAERLEQFDNKTANTLLTTITKYGEFTAQLAQNENDIFSKIETHQKARDAIRNLVTMYHKDLCLKSKQAANDDKEKDIITEKHVKKGADRLPYRPPPKHIRVLLNALHTVGGPCLGSGLALCLSTPAHERFAGLGIALLVFGGLMFGGALVGKLLKR